MAIDLPNLDDLDYDDLLAPAMASIGALDPRWTHQSPSDPGVTLIEMFAWLTDMMVYRTNQIPPASWHAFLELLDPAYRPGVSLEHDIAVTLGKLDEVYRAVTTGDYELLAMQNFPLARVSCSGDASGNVSLVVVPNAGSDAPWCVPSGPMLGDVKAFFDDRRLVTTRVAPVAPNYVDVSIAATLHLTGDADDRVVDTATQALIDYFHPWPDEPGAADWPRGKRARAAGWPFGRAVYASEVTKVLSAVRGVAFVDGTSINGSTDPVKVGAGGLPRVRGTNVELPTSTLDGSMGQRGTQWVPSEQSS